jgi:hypothetical protein
MDDPAALKQEINYLTAEAERLRRERDSYREQNEARQAKAEDTISTQLRLLSADLSNKVQTDFFSLLKWVGGIVVIALTVATAGGFFTFSTLINTTVDREVREQVRDKVKEKDEDIKSLRTSIIQGAVDFRREADKSVAEIRANADKILAEIRASAGQVKEARESALREIAPRPANPPPSIETAAVTPPPPEIFNIQVVVQVVYRTPEENISDEQIKSQIVVLNEDYRAKNADISKVPEPFKPFIGDARIQFSLATIDPAGRPTTGITRTRTNKPAFSDDDGVKSRSKGGADAWDTERYLNIWVATLAGGLLNYSQFPGGQRTPMASSAPARHSVPLGPSKRLSTRDVARRMRSVITWAFGTLGGMQTIVPVAIWSRTRRFSKDPTSASPPFPTSPATTVPTATCS